MGRKIPGRKHRGVKDPEKQAAERFNKIKDKINAPPTDPNEQEIPKSLQRIIDLRNKTKSGQFKRKKKLKKTSEEASENGIDLSFKNGKSYKGRPEKPVPEFKQLPNETNREFLNRVTRICQDVTKEVAFEEKYGVEIKRNEAGEVDVVKRPKDELELLLKQAKRKKKEIKGRKKKKTKVEAEKIKLTKSQKWQLKKKEKKQKKRTKNSDEFENYKDQVKFGEIVHAPPTLSAPRKIEKTQIAPRPGRKDLLLKPMLEKKRPISRKQKSSKGGEDLQRTLSKVIDKKGKRRDLPNALRRQLDSQQKEIISAYKSLKAKKYNS